MLETGIGRAHNIHLSTLPNFRLPGDIAASRRYYRAGSDRAGRSRSARRHRRRARPVPASACAVEHDRVDARHACGTRRCRPREATAPPRGLSCSACSLASRVCRRPRTSGGAARRRARASSRSCRGSCASKINGCCATRCATRGRASSREGKKRKRRRRLTSRRDDAGPRRHAEGPRRRASGVARRSRPDASLAEPSAPLSALMASDPDPEVRQMAAFAPGPRSDARTPTAPCARRLPTSRRSCAAARPKRSASSATPPAPRPSAQMVRRT